MKDEEGIEKWNIIDKIRLFVVFGKFSKFWD